MGSEMCIRDRDIENKILNFDLSDDILKGCVVTHEGQIVNELVKTME